MISHAAETEAPGAMRRRSIMGLDVGRNGGSSGTTRTERFLLMSTIAILPLQSYLPRIMGFSVLFVLFGILGAYLVVWRPRALIRVSQHPVFGACYVLVGIGLFMEIIHESYAYYEVIRMSLMILGGIFIAALCRDQKAFLSGTYGILLASLWLSVALFLTVYGLLSSTTVGDVAEANRLRAEVFSDGFLGNDLNYMSFFTAQGAIVALALALTAKSIVRRYRLLVVGGLCSVATFLPMSRGGIAILVLACGSVVYAHGIMQSRVIQAGVLLAVTVVAFTPDAAFQRFNLSAASQPRGKEDGRARVYSAVIKHFPEYAVTGVGISQFYGGWGLRTGFVKDDGVHVSGAHNIFAQVTLLWGISALGALLAVSWLSYRCIPKGPDMDPLRLCLIGISVSVLLESFLSHVIPGKQYSIALGMIVGAFIWIRRQPLRNSSQAAYRQTLPVRRRRMRPVNVSGRSIEGFRR
jgi:hypothetical protein